MIVNFLQIARWGWPAAVLAALLQTGLAHDMFETTTVAKPNGVNLEVRLTLSRHGANDLLKQAGSEGGGLNLLNFDSVRPQLAEQAAKLFEVSVGDSVLPLTESEVVAGEEGDVEFLLTYARPAAGQVQLHAAFVAQLGRGYRAQLTLLNDAGGGPIIWLKQRDNPVLEWALKPGGDAKPALTALASTAQAKTQAAMTASATSAEHLNSAAASQRETPETAVTIFRPLLFVMLLCMGGATFWLLRRRTAC
jgi:hypothetical protein